MLPELQDRRESEFLRFRRAGALVDTEMAHRVRRAGIQAPAAGFADTDLFGNPLIGLDLGFRQNTGQVDSGPEFRRQDVHFKSERAEPGLDP